MNQKDATGKTALQRVSFLAAATQDKKHYATIKTLILLGAHAHTLGSDVLATLPSNLSAFIKLSLTRPIQSLAQQAVFNTDGSDVCREGEFVSDGRLQNVRLSPRDSSGKYYADLQMCTRVHNHEQTHGCSAQCPGLLRSHSRVVRAMHGDKSKPQTRALIARRNTQPLLFSLAKPDRHSVIDTGTTTEPLQAMLQRPKYVWMTWTLRSARTSLIGALAIITANTFGMDYSNHASTTSGITAGDHANMRLGNNYDHQAHTGATASGDAKQYNGNVINTNTYHYSLPQKRSDGKLGENERNEVFLQAAKQGQLPRVRYLLQCGADVDHTDQHGKSGLHHAAVKGYTDVVEHLISHGVGIDTVDVEGETALYNATQRGRTNVVAILLGARADPIAGDGAHGWPLHVAYWKREIWTL
ncbi:putative ankyrin repeat-containing domain superfamily [Septoria linicola]|nr:putative ankyrin repeat-containing domain superfamily [Septoria linicola]